MKVRLSDILAPDYCLSCGEIGSILCEHCKYDIVGEAYGKCISCGNISPASSNLCRACVLPYSNAWCVGERHDILQRLLDAYKFNRSKSAVRILAGFLDATLPFFPDEMVVTYVTTIRPHVRQRGYDHARELAKELAKRRGLICQETLMRTTSTRQLGAGRRQRIENAKRAFAPKTSIKAQKYLLIDDIYTTGSTLEYGAKALRSGGASDVMVAVIARQPLEKTHHL